MSNPTHQEIVDRVGDDAEIDFHFLFFPISGIFPPLLSCQKLPEPSQKTDRVLVEKLTGNTSLLRHESINVI